MVYNKFNNSSRNYHDQQQWIVKCLFTHHWGLRLAVVISLSKQNLGLSKDHFIWRKNSFFKSLSMSDCVNASRKYGVNNNFSLTLTQIINIHIMFYKMFNTPNYVWTTSSMWLNSIVSIFTCNPRIVVSLSVSCTDRQKLAHKWMIHVGLLDTFFSKFLIILISVNDNGKEVFAP